MNEDLARLAPPIDPLSPPPTVDGTALAAIALGVGALALVVLATLVLRRLWCRWRLARALQRIDAEGPAVTAAQDLATLVRRFALAASPQWWRAVDALRFAPGRDAAPVEIVRLRNAVPGFGRRRR